MEISPPIPLCTPRMTVVRRWVSVNPIPFLCTWTHRHTHTHTHTHRVCAYSHHTWLILWLFCDVLLSLSNSSLNLPISSHGSILFDFCIGHQVLCGVLCYHHPASLYWGRSRLAPVLHDYKHTHLFLCTNASIFVGDIFRSRIAVSKGMRTDRERQISYDIAYMWNLNKMIQMNLYTKWTHRHRKQIYGYQRGKGGGDKLGVLD